MLPRMRTNRYLGYLPIPFRIHVVVCRSDVIYNMLQIRSRLTLIKKNSVLLTIMFLLRATFAYDARTSSPSKTKLCNARLSSRKTTFVKQIGIRCGGKVKHPVTQGEILSNAVPDLPPGLAMTQQWLRQIWLGDMWGFRRRAYEKSRIRYLPKMQWLALQQLPSAPSNFAGG